MPMKCIDQMLPPAATAAPASHKERIAPAEVRARRQMSYATNEPMMASAIEIPTMP